jgi:hypothetical protein
MKAAKGCIRHRWTKWVLNKAKYKWRNCVMCYEVQTKGRRR